MASDLTSHVTTFDAVHCSPGTDRAPPGAGEPFFVMSYVTRASTSFQNMGEIRRIWTGHLSTGRLQAAQKISLSQVFLEFIKPTMSKDLWGMAEYELKSDKPIPLEA